MHMVALIAMHLPLLSSSSSKEGSSGVMTMGVMYLSGVASHSLKAHGPDQILALWAALKTDLKPMPAGHSHDCWVTRLGDTASQFGNCTPQATGTVRVLSQVKSASRHARGTADRSTRLVYAFLAVGKCMASVQ